MQILSQLLCLNRFGQSVKLTGDFLLATKKSGFDWDDVIDLNDCTLYLGENNSLQLYGGCDYGDFNFELKEKGNQLILTVAEKL